MEIIDERSSFRTAPLDYFAYISLKKEGLEATASGKKDNVVLRAIARFNPADISHECSGSKSEIDRRADTVENRQVHALESSPVAIATGEFPGGE